MLFSSLEFLYLFLPLTLVLYFACPCRCRNLVLLIVSLVFYGLGEPMYVFLMVGTVAADYAFGLAIERFPGRARVLLWSAVIFNLALLGFFKYYDFFASVLSRVSGFSFLRPLSLSLPIGISFYTFQALSYVIDVYRHTVAAQRDLVRFGTYVSLFPQLVAGPIVRYSDIANELDERTSDLRGAAEGIRRFAVGLSKKVLFANAAGALWESIRIANGEDASMFGAWLGILAYTFQIYFDFSGYSDMAIGLGRIFGFHFPENFRYPYVAQSVSDFWRRWHITLSSWFREYVYIPLGGNRCGKLRMYRNLLVTWALTGFWHGASWNFLFWGLYFFVLLSVEKAFLGKVLSHLPRPVRHLYALLAIVLGWLIFAFDGSLDSLSLAEGVRYAGNLIGIGTRGFSNGHALYEWTRHLPLILLMALGATPIPAHAAKRMREKYPRVFGIGSVLLTLFALIVCSAYLVDSGYNPFLYFRF